MSGAFLGISIITLTGFVTILPPRRSAALDLESSGRDYTVQGHAHRTRTFPKGYWTLIGN